MMKTIEERAEAFVRKEILCLDTMLVDMLLMGENLFSWDNITNLHVPMSDAMLPEFFYEEYFLYNKDDDQVLSFREFLLDDCGVYEEDMVEDNKIYEWWRVSDWFADKLEEYDAPVLRNDYGTWWGRTTTGQACYMDAVIHRIVKDLYTEEVGEE